MKTPKLSIILPCYNHEDYISNCLTCIIEQKFNDYEVLILDDASSDSTELTISKWLQIQRDERFNYIRNQVNIGATKNFNKGLSIAKGNYIVFLSGDDYWSSEFLKTLMDVLEEHNYDYVFCKTAVIDHLGKYLRSIPDDELSLDNYNSILNAMLFGNIIAGHSVIFKKEFIDRFGYFNENLKYLSDWEFLLRLVKNCKGIYIPQELAYYRIHGSNMIFRQYEGDRALDELIFVMDTYLKDVEIQQKNIILKTNLFNHAASCLYNYNYVSARKTLHELIKILGFSVFKDKKIALCYFLSYLSFNPITKLVMAIRRKKFKHF